MRVDIHPAAPSGPSAPSMFDDEDEGADLLEEEDGSRSDDDAFVTAKPQVSSNLGTLHGQVSNFRAVYTFMNCWSSHPQPKIMHWLHILSLLHLF
jgi:hypothetical protein